MTNSIHDTSIKVDVFPDEIDNRIWLYIDDYFTFTNND